MKTLAQVIFVLAVLFGLLSYHNAYLIGEPSSLRETQDLRLRKDLTERWAQRAVEALGDFDGRPRVCLASVTGDVDSLVRDELEYWLARRNVVLVDLAWVNARKAWNGVASLGSGSARDGDSGADYLLFADVSEWTTFPEHEAKLSGSIIVQNLSGGERSVSVEESLGRIVTVSVD
ncbi:MAG: hypothetical protein AAGJ46_12735 [Planctomycetota bacterium]